MKKIFRAIPFILVLGLIFYWTISGWSQMNWMKICGFTLGLIITIYLLFIVITDKYIDFRNNLKIKSIGIDTDSSSIDNNL